MVCGTGVYSLNVSMTREKSNVTTYIQYSVVLNVLLFYFSEFVKREKFGRVSG